MGTGTNGKKMSVTVVCGHASDVIITLAQMAPEAPILGRMGVTAGTAPPVAALLLRLETILGSSTRVEYKWETRAEKVPAIPFRFRQFTRLVNSLLKLTDEMECEKVRPTDSFVEVTRLIDLLAS